MRAEASLFCMPTIRGYFFRFRSGCMRMQRTLDSDVDGKALQDSVLAEDDSSLAEKTRKVVC